MDAWSCLVWSGVSLMGMIAAIVARRTRTAEAARFVSTLRRTPSGPRPAYASAARGNSNNLPRRGARADAVGRRRDGARPGPSPGALMVPDSRREFGATRSHDAPDVGRGLMRWGP